MLFHFRVNFPVLIRFVPSIGVFAFERDASKSCCLFYFYRVGLFCLTVIVLKAKPKQIEAISS